MDYVPILKIKKLMLSTFCNWSAFNNQEEIQSSTDFLLPFLITRLFFHDKFPVTYLQGNK